MCVCVALRRTDGLSRTFPLPPTSAFWDPLLPQIEFHAASFHSERRFYVFYSAKLQRASIFSQGDIILQCFWGPDSFV